MAMETAIKVALADDEALFRQGMRLLIEDFGGMTVVLEAENGQHLIERLAQADPFPEVLLLDLNMPQLNGVEAARQLQQNYPDLHIVVLSTYYSKQFILSMLEIGAGAYLAKNSLPEEVEHTIREVAAQGYSYSPEVMRIIQENLRKKSKPKPSFAPELTAREREVLQLICEQHTTAEIADQLFISQRTVDGHRNNLLQKLGCRNTAGLVAYAIQNRLVSIAPGGFWDL